MALNMPSKCTFLKARTNLLLISVQQESPVAKKRFAINWEAVSYAICK